MKIKLSGFILLFILLVGFYLLAGNPSLHILQQIRIPRLMLTFISGFILGGVGYSFQILLNNPLAEPYILGISSGAGFGSILAVTLGLFVLMPVSGFVFALLTMYFVWKIAHLQGFFSKTRLILAGIIVGMFFSALISLLIYLNQQEIGSILQILMGNLGRIFSVSEWRYFVIIFIFAIGLMLYLFSLSQKLNILTTGDLISESLGIDVRKLRKKIFIIASLLTAITVSYAGIIGFVGLVVPHIIRLMFPGNNKYNIVLAAFGGAFFLISCDIIAARISVVSLPVGIITAFIGSPFFLYIMIKSR